MMRTIPSTMVTGADALKRFLNVIRPARIVAVAIVIAVPALLANFRSVVFELLNVPSYIGSYERRADLRYGNLERQSLDVYVPRGANRRPVVVFWYGGTWQRGSKDEFRFVGAALADAGYVAVVPNYRLYPKVRYPAFVDDGALVLKWAHAHADELGGDPEAIFLMGHSSGGHIAAMLALDEQHIRNVGGDRSWVHGWIALSTPYELKWHMPVTLSIFNTRKASEWRPIGLVSGRAPSALLIHGLEDDMVHPLEAVHMEQKLRTVGVPVICRIPRGSDHVDTVMSLASPLQTETGTLAQVRAFIDRAVAGTLRSDPSDACPAVDGRKS